MSERLPREIDPLRLADEGARLEGELPGRLFLRLFEQAPPGTTPEPVRFQLEFERTAYGIRLLRGRIQARVDATCQRCLQPVRLDLEAKPLLALLSPGETAGGAPEEAETLVVEGPVSLAALVEDELLLGMPMIPMHAHEHCAAPVAGSERAGAETQGLFGALRGLKSGK